MPGASLHLTHAELLSRDRDVAAPLREAMAAEIVHARFGSVFVDIPFYTNIVTMMLGYWLEMPAETCRFAQMMHRYNPDRFAWHFLAAIQRDSSLPPAQRLAIMGGFFSHIALDLELHPLVNWCARREVAAWGGHESHHHRLTEKYHSLFFHLEQTGRDIIGSPEMFTDKTRIIDGPAFFRLPMDMPVIRWSTDMLAGFYHEAAPSMRQLAAWIRAFRHFGFMVSLPAAARNSRRLGNQANRDRYYENDAFRFIDFWERGYARSVALLNRAYEVYASGDFSSAARESFLEAAAISDLADPPERGLLPEQADIPPEQAALQLTG